MSEQNPVPESPTGAPYLPQWVLTVAIVAVTAAGVILPFLPENSPYAIGCQVVIAVGAAFGIGSHLKRRGGLLVVLFAAGLSLQGCATLQQPRPIGEPSPLACYGAKRTRDAWEDLISKYVDEMMRAQVAYSCAPTVPTEPPVTLPTNAP